MTVTSRIDSEDIQKVFDHWVTVCRPTHRIQPVLSEKRRRKIADAIRLYGVETCVQAIDGITYSDFHMGANNRGKKYDDIELVLRDAEHIERFAELYHDQQNRGSHPRMTNEELPKIVDLVISGWNLQVAGVKRIDMEKTWWRYLKDIPYDAALQAIDKLVVRDGPPPRVGAVRRLAMEQGLTSLPPEPAEAWAQAREFASSLDAGVVSDRVPTVHPLVLTAIRAGIREYRSFVEFYTNKLQEWRDNMFGIKQ